jgi:hypothetical protein
MSHAKSYELTFPASGDTVVVSETERKGAGGHPVYADETGIIQAEISDRGEVRMLASGGHQNADLPRNAVARP